ncbi:hypothetical protein ACHQM5_017821 [Ranunculus cassubicifolius]
MTPVESCIQILTNTVIMNMVRATIFVKDSDSGLTPREGIRNPMEIQMNVVPLSFDN